MLARSLFLAPFPSLVAGLDFRSLARETSRRVRDARKTESERRKKKSQGRGYAIGRLLLSARECRPVLFSGRPSLPAAFLLLFGETRHAVSLVHRLLELVDFSRGESMTTTTTTTTTWKSFHYHLISAPSRSAASNARFSPLLLPPQTRYTKRPMSSACPVILELYPRRAFLFRRR